MAPTKSQNIPGVALMFHMASCMKGFPFKRPSSTGLSLRIEPPRTEEDLQDLLEGSGTDTTQFGRGQANSLMTLLRELHESSCRLERVPTSKKILRFVEPVFIQLTYRGQVIVGRGHALDDTRLERHNVLSVKRRPGDANPLEAAIRGIKEMLGVSVSLDTEGLVYSPEIDGVTFVSNFRGTASYPGLPAVYKTHHVRLNILTGSSAERAFECCGIPACKPFRSKESLRLSWEWMGFHEARKNGVKGMVLPENVTILNDPFELSCRGF